MSSQAIDNEEKAEAGRAQRVTETTIQSVMKTYEGRWWMAQILDHCNPIGQRYKFDGDALGAMYRDGMGAVGQMLLEQIDLYAPDEYQRMIRERRKRMAQAAERGVEKERAQQKDDPPIWRDPPAQAWSPGEA